MSLRLVCTGDIIKDYLEEAKITQKDLAKRMGYSEKNVSNVLNGKVRLTEDFALRLEKILTNVPASYWLNYEAKYREQLAREKELYHLEELDLDKISKQFHFNEVFNKLDLSIQDQAIEMLKLLQISSFSQFDEVYSNFKLDFMEDGGENEAIAIWINMCREEIEIQNNEHIIDYKEKNLKNSLSKFKILALNKDIDKALSSCRKLCNSIGIYLVVLDAITNCKVRGALTTYQDHPAIYLSKRFKSHDNVWFAFMHEIAHLLYHYNPKDTLISYDENDYEKEDEANTFARDFFIDPNQYNNFITSNNFNEKNIIKFAKSQNILPGILVARLQHDKLIDYNQFNYLK